MPRVPRTFRAWLRRVIIGAGLANLPLALLVAVSSRVRNQALAVVAEQIPPRVVLVGDSLTAAGGPWLGGNPLRTRNLGRGGFTAGQMHPVMRQAIAARPQWIVLCAGANDVTSRHYSEAETFADIQQMLELARATGIRVVLTLVPQRAQHIEAIDSLNAALRDLPVDALIDLNPTLAPDGTLDEQYRVDDVHFSELALDVWATNLRVAIQ